MIPGILVHEWILLTFSYLDLWFTVSDSKHFVIILIKAATGYLYHLTSSVVNSMDLKTSGKHGMKKVWAFSELNQFKKLILKRYLTKC